MKFVLLALMAVTVTTLNLPGIPIELTEDDEVISAISDDIAHKFSKEYLKFMETGVESATLKQLTSQLRKSHSKNDMFTTSISELSSADQFFMCTTCRAVANVMADTFRADDGELNGPNAEANSKKIVLEVCKRFHIQTSEVCGGLVDLNWPIMHHIVMNSKSDARSFCGTLPITFCQVKQTEYNWSVNVDNTKGLLKAPKSDVPMKSAKDLTIVQLSDIHYDSEYVTGSLADCEEPICCRLTPTGIISDEAKAGYWSDYRNCDSPMHMIKDAFDNINKNYQNIDYIYQTGDIVPHNVWSTTKEGNKAVLTEINDLIAEKFAGIPYYPCVGNHESHPTNVFGNEDVPTELKVSWLYEHLWTIWQRWLPADAKATVLKGGYYTVSPKAGFRVIALNNNDCYILNWWIFYDGAATSQPQLDWLQNTLLAAEKAGEHVHILAHIPSGDWQCWNVWSREYNRIIERYSHIISGIFAGHTHFDEMSLHYSTEGHAMAISWNGGSLTSYSHMNPNYKAYEIEPQTYQVVDSHTWIFNLTEANEHSEHRSPIWFKEYQFTEFTNDLSPAGIDALLVKMAQDPDTLRKWWNYKMISSDPKIAAGCNDKCLLKTICSLATTASDDKTRCNELKVMLKESLEKETPTTTGATPTTPEGGDDGAASLTASITSIVALLYMNKYFLF